MPKDPRVDAYIAKAAPFARPILAHFREVVHAACPTCEETLKWGAPHFDYKGEMMASMAAFKAHCAVGFWKGKLVVDDADADALYAAGMLGRITQLSELPSRAKLTRYIKRAMKLNDAGVKAPRPPKKAAPKASAVPPADLVAALKKNRAAAATFAAFPPGHRREYIVWITEAKGEDTRKRRLQQAVEWIAEGKSRNWKYQRKR